MTKLFCDICTQEHSKSLPIYEYQIKAEFECIKSSDTEKYPDYAIEFERIEICQVCANAVARKCSEFVKQFVKYSD